MSLPIKFDYGCKEPEVPMHERSRLIDEDLLNGFHQTNSYHATFIYDDKYPKWLRGMHKTWINQLKNKYEESIERIMLTYELKQYSGHDRIILDYK